MERPTGVTILAVLGFVAAGMSVLAAIAMFLGGAFLSNVATRPGLGALAGIGGAIIGVVFLGFAALYVVTGLGLWNLQNWARVLIIVLLGISVLFTLAWHARSAGAHSHVPVHLERDHRGDRCVDHRLFAEAECEASVRCYGILRFGRQPQAANLKPKEPAVDAGATSCERWPRNKCVVSLTVLLRSHTLVASHKAADMSRPRGESAERQFKSHLHRSGNP